MSEKQYLLVIDHITDSVFGAIRHIRHTYKEFSNLELVFLTTNPEKYQQHKDKEEMGAYIHCDFLDDQEIARNIDPFLSSLVGVICRGDKQIQYLRKVIPLLPMSIRVSSMKSLVASTNKKLMREAFRNHYPEITPRFLQVQNSSVEMIDKIESALDYPIIIKPAHLASSMLIQSCHNSDELKQSLQRVFKSAGAIYKQEGRRGAPEIIVEEYLEGEFYSIDAYVDESQQIFFCPPVGYIPAKQLGIDDFFLYKRFIPTQLSTQDIENANEMTRKAMTALELKHSSAHVELVLTKNGWKIIELGPRIGRFRHNMYYFAYGIHHSLNDMKIHLGLEPDIPNQLHKFCTAYSIYPDHEGMLEQIVGWDKLMKMPEVLWNGMNSQPGDQCRFAKNGGSALAEFIVASSNQEQYDQLIQWIEKNVYAVIKT